jgi:L-fucose isomerase-like protein
MSQNRTGTEYCRYVLRVSWAAHRGAAADTAAEAEKFMGSLLPDGTFTMTESHPDVILFMSGGSERRAIELADPARPVLLLSIRGNNAYAAATEVMAWMVNRRRIAMLSDAYDASDSGLIDRWRMAAGASETLHGRRAGLIGTVSEWLVASDVTAQTLRERFGVELIGIPWETLPDYSKEDPDLALLDRFGEQKSEELDDAARVLTILRRALHERGLAAIAVECFSLVQERKVTACLALAQLNSEGMIATCEGDIASMAGMMAGKALTGSVPWMANTTRITHDTLILSHCTIGFDLADSVSLRTHYETGRSLAVDGLIPAGHVTLFRFSDKLDRAFIAGGEIVNRPHLADACRTQVEIKLSDNHLRILRESPLGNHILMIPGNHEESFKMLCRFKNINHHSDD